MEKFASRRSFAMKRRRWLDASRDWPGAHPRFANRRIWALLDRERTAGQGVGRSGGREVSYRTPAQFPGIPDTGRIRGDL